MRKQKEIIEYMDEAFDKVWIVRSIHSNPCENADFEKKRTENIERILSKYKNVPENDWEYGYWSGILASLRWVLGDEKDFLDT